MAVCLEEARHQGDDIPADCSARQVADLQVDCWEGAAPRSRLRRNAMLDFISARLPAKTPALRPAR
jgi:TetR/AcrR family transcriptional repressor of nem operon